MVKKNEAVTAKGLCGERSTSNRGTGGRGMDGLLLLRIQSIKKPKGESQETHWELVILAVVRPTHRPKMRACLECRL